MNILRRVSTALLITSSLMLAGCVSVGDIADSLSRSVLNQGDPEIVREGAPAYLILIDSLLERDPDNPAILMAGSRLYGSYGSAFLTDQERASYMSTKAFKYAKSAVCLRIETLCDIQSLSTDELLQQLQEVDDVEDDVPLLYGLGTAWAGWVQVHSSNWSAVADLPKVESLMRRILELDNTYDNGGVHIYMGVLLTQRPAALGGEPEKGRQHFEQAIEIGAGRNLMAKVLYAENYARLLFNEELHNRLLNEVIQADAEAPSLTLINTLAKKRARELLITGKEYF